LRKTLLGFWITTWKRRWSASLVKVEADRLRPI